MTSTPARMDENGREWTRMDEDGREWTRMDENSLIVESCQGITNEECQMVEGRIVGVGLGRVVREVLQHPDDHEFESQRWQ
jgi:hypothetical protein